MTFNGICALLRKCPGKVMINYDRDDKVYHTLHITTIISNNCGEIY